MAVSLQSHIVRIAIHAKMFLSPDDAISLTFLILYSEPENRLLFRMLQATSMTSCVCRGPRVKSHAHNSLNWSMQRQALLSCVCKSGFARLRVDCSKDQRSQKIACIVMNSAFSVYSDNVQDIAMQFGLVPLAQIACRVKGLHYNCRSATPDFGSLGLWVQPGSSGSRSSIYSLPILKGS